MPGVKAVQAEADCGFPACRYGGIQAPREARNSWKTLQKQLDTYQSGQKESQKNANYLAAEVP